MNLNNLDNTKFNQMLKRSVYLFISIITLVLVLFFALYLYSNTSWFEKNNSNDPAYIEAEKQVKLQYEVAQFWTPKDIELISDSIQKQKPRSSCFPM